LRAVQRQRQSAVIALPGTRGAQSCTDAVSSPII